MNAAQPGVLIAMKNTSGLCISHTATRLTRLGKTMAKTLADMTAEERADCVGMWAEHAHPHYDGLEVIIDSDHDSMTTISTKSGQQYIVVGEVMRHITPRFDLPRAWTPDGEPVGTSREYGQCEIGGTPDGEFATIVHVDGGGTEYAPDNTPHGEVYRWVGEWEQDNE